MAIKGEKEIRRNQVNIVRYNELFTWSNDRYMWGLWSGRKRKETHRFVIIAKEREKIRRNRVGIIRDNELVTKSDDWYM